MQGCLAVAEVGLALVFLVGAGLLTRKPDRRTQRIIRLAFRREGRAVYGINTGFGRLAKTRVPSASQAKSYHVGQGRE